MKTQIVLGVAAVALGLVVVKSFSPALAYQGDPTVKGPNYSEERHQVNMTAFQKNDYKAWVANMNGKGVTRFVNEANFGEFAKAQLKAQNEGDPSLVKAFRDKYRTAGGSGKGQGMGMHRNSQ